MKRTRLGSLVIISAALAATALAVPVLAVPALAAPSPAAPATESDTPSFQKFKASTFRDVDGVCVVNGDEPVSDGREVHGFYDGCWPATRRPSTSSSTPSRGRRHVVGQPGRRPDLPRQHEVRQRPRARRAGDGRRRGHVGRAPRPGSTTYTCPARTASARPDAALYGS